MSIVQKIEYKANFKYFPGFIQHLLDQSGLNGSVTQEADGTIALILDEKEPEALEKFGHMTQKYLPHSIFIGEIKTEKSDKEPLKARFKSPAYPIAPCPICLKMLTDPASDRYLDDTIVCDHYSNDEVYEDSDYTIFSPHFNENDTILLADANKIADLFIVTEDEIKALFSIEKPTLKLTIKDEEIKRVTGKNYFRVKAPYNIKSSLAALSAKESGIEYLFFNERNNEPMLVMVQKNIHMVHDNRVSEPLSNIDEDRCLNRFANVMAEAGFSEATCAYMSRRSGISFMVSNRHDRKRAVTFQPFDIEKSLKRMEEDSTRARLLQNFKEKFPAAYDRLQNRNLDIYGAAAAVLELESDTYDALSDKSLEFHGNGGLKIDMNFNDEGFDYVAMLGSIMSFRLAGAETHYLAYSIFEAYGDMVVSVLGQLKNKFKIDNAVLLGDLFENSVLFSRVLSKLQNSKPYISAKIALDE